MSRLAIQLSVLVGVFVFTQVEKARALSGVGAELTQVSGGNSVFVSGRHAPNSEIVVITSSGDVVAVAKDTGTGKFSFDFRALPGQGTELELFAIDPADETRPVVMSTQGLSDELLPPTLVADPERGEEDDSLRVGGYSFPGAEITLVLTGDNGVNETEKLITEVDGGWSFEYLNLKVGNYELVAISKFNSLESYESFPLEFSVEAKVQVPVVDDVSKTVSKAVEKVAEMVLPPVITKVVRDVAPQFEQVNNAVTPVASASLLTQFLLVARDLLYWLLQAGIAGLQYFGFWKKRHPWGVVYDAFTKQPLMLATVRLYTSERLPKLVETDVTSKAGVFSFFPEMGKYRIKVAKSGYSFPSLLVRTSSDGEYDHVYHGEEIIFSGGESVVEVAVPIDPSEVNVGLRFKIVNFLRTRVYWFTIGMLLVGWGLSLIAVVGGRGGANGFMLGFYSLVLTVHGYLGYRRSKTWGVVADVNGNYLPGIQLDLVDPKFERLVQRRVSDAKGKYQFVVPEGLYQIRIGSVGFDLVSGKHGWYGGEEIVVRGQKPQLITVKLMLERTGGGGGSGD